MLCSKFPRLLRSRLLGASMLPMLWQQNACRAQVSHAPRIWRNIREEAVVNGIRAYASARKNTLAANQTAMERRTRIHAKRHKSRARSCFGDRDDTAIGWCLPHAMQCFRASFRARAFCGGSGSFRVKCASEFSRPVVNVTERPVHHSQAPAAAHFRNGVAG